MAQRAILAVDEGTTGVTALVLDSVTGRVRGRAASPVAIRTPKPGWVEQDAKSLWNASRKTARLALAAARVDAEDVAAIGVTNQRETTIVWDRRTGTPVGPAIVWQDRRTAARCDALRPDWDGHVRRKTGLVLDPYFCATKIEWLLAQRRSRDRAKRGELAFGTVDSWLAFQATGCHITDITNASRTMLWDIHKGDWDAELLQLFGIPERLLPEVTSSAFDPVPTLGLVSNRTGSAHPAPLAALVGDQQSALAGQGCVRAGEAKNTYGTGAFLLQHTGGKAVASKNGLITTRAASTSKRPQFALEGSVFVAGALIQWLRDNLGTIATSRDIDLQAARVTDSAGVVIVPAFTGLGAPHWDAHARASILGLTRGTRREHLARAALEAIAFQVDELLRAMEADAGRRIRDLRVDGGVAKSDLMLQLQADISGRRIVRPAELESTALGAGHLAGVAVDAWRFGEHPGHDEVKTAGAKTSRAASSTTNKKPRTTQSSAARTFTPTWTRKRAAAAKATWASAVAATRTFQPHGRP